MNLLFVFSIKIHCYILVFMTSTHPSVIVADAQLDDDISVSLLQKFWLKNGLLLKAAKQFKEIKSLILSRFKLLLLPFGLYNTHTYPSNCISPVAADVSVNFKQKMPST